jgi:hypothetical protein
MKWYDDLNLQLMAAGASMDWWRLVGLACLGGALPDLWRVYRTGFKIAATRVFWISLFILTAVAGFVTYFIKPERPIEAFALGYATAQMIYMVFASKTPSPIIKVSEGSIRGTPLLPGWAVEEALNRMKLPNPWKSLQQWWASR